MLVFFYIVNLINLLLIMFMIFIEHKRLHRVAIWLLVFTFLPILSFVIYLLLGIGVLNKKSKYQKIYNLTRLNKLTIKNNIKNVKKTNKYRQNIVFNALNCNSLYLDNENIDIFANTNMFLRNVKADLLNAKHSIFLLSYIFSNDIVGSKIKDILIKKAKQGVKVVVIYDSFGSKKTNKIFFNELKENNVEVIEFFPALLKIFQLNINYRNHRKIIIIDNKISYIGGVNFRDDHFNKNEKLSPWRDTHLRVVGKTSLELLKMFLQDLKLSKPKIENNFIDNNFNFKNTKQNYAQVISSSPLDKGQKIEDSFINLINSSINEVIIETPYLILDDKFINCLKRAVLNGVKVIVLIPKLIDKKFVYNASLYNAKKLLELGVDVYLYNGFLHAKTLLIDKNIFVCGSCNFDMRSFYLNFESSLIVFDEKLSKKFYKTMLKDLKESSKLEKNFYKKLPAVKRLAISFCSLFSPIL